MGLNDLMYWYQKKIGTYDKQQWEKTIEQRILGGFTHIPMKTAKLKPELIDVDLVRGSSFPKAKPKHGLATVARLAVQRLLLLPLHTQWWVQQTSPSIFALFLLLYCLQLFNVGVYYHHIIKENNESEIVSASEVLTPIAMMLTLCIIHSQIVSTSSGPPLGKTRNGTKARRSKRRRCHFGKNRTQRNLRINESKSSQDTASEKASTVSGEVPPSVRFAKKVLIENSSVLEPLQHRMRNVALESHSENEAEDELIQNRNSPIIPVPLINPIIPIEEQVEVPLEVEGDADNEVAHQDDDGFESLNGNVSSDNGEAAADQLPVAPSEGEAEVEKNTEGDGAGKSGCPEDRRAWLEELMEGRRPDQDGTIPCRFPAPIVRTKRGNFTDSERETCDSPDGVVPPSLGTGRVQLCESEEEGECEDAIVNHLTEATTSATEWMGVTTNSDECSYSSELEESDSHSEMNMNHSEFVEHPFSWEFELSPSILLSPSCTSSDRVSCTIWTRRDIKKAELSVLDISSAIIARVESMPESMDYFYGGLGLSVILSLIPSIWRLSDHIGKDPAGNVTGSLMSGDLSQDIFNTFSDTLCRIIDIGFGITLWERTVILVSLFERLTLSCLLFFLLAVAERTFKQRLLYAKLFSHLTSSRRARKSDLPHFRLNKVRNIKTWLSVRSYLKRRGPQRSVDVIVSAVFIVTLLLLSYVSLEFIKDLENLHSQYNVEALFWSFALGIFILRFMTLGTKINRKYRNLSVLITEQINLYLQIEQKPHKKDELMVANSVLKLAADLLKELESPFKISGLSANPYLYTITKVVILSALSGVLSELLGFKLKLHKIKIK